MPKPNLPETLTPNRLALRSGLWGVFTCGYILVLPVLLPVLRAARPHLLFRSIGVLPLLAGMLVSFYFIRRLEVGVKANLWSAAELETVRRIFNEQWVRFVVMVCAFLFVGCSCFMLYEVASGRRHYIQMIGFVPLLVGNITGTLSAAVRPPKPPSSEVLLRPDSAAPLQSEQWGERQTSLSR